ncbi:MAG: DUF3800 domain-containing protein [Albidovulum sp.]|nr:DUF3800 domain-containing protein [Albidovulum sp.]
MTGFLDQIFIFLRRHDVRIVARIWIKEPGTPFSGKSVYASSIQCICGYFENYMTTTDSTGACIADSRAKHTKSNVSLSILTQKFGTANRYRSLIEPPTFGHCRNHAALQICDIVCSALLYPFLRALPIARGMWTTSMCNPARPTSGSRRAGASQAGPNPAADARLAAHDRQSP